ncbi:MAG: cyclophilin-like fold protein [Pseudomonadota bacterium]
MKSSFQISRRSFVGAILAASLAPRLAFGQSKSDGELMKVEFAFSRHVFQATLFDNPSSRDFVSMLPLDLMIDDYANNEKIAYLPRKLTEEGSGPFGDEAPGDLCYYAPWGNLAFFYAGYRYSRGLIRLGRLDGGFDPLLTKGEFPLSARIVGNGS